jgi:putative transposase
VKPIKTGQSFLVKNGPKKQGKVIHREGPWRSMEAVEYATLEWIDWFNNRRLLEPIGNIPSAEAASAYCSALEEPAKLAA